MKLGDKGIINSAGKRITPAIAWAIHGMGGTQALQLLVSYLDLLVGKGYSSAWDNGEEKAAGRVIRKLTANSPIIIDCGGNRGRWTEGVRHVLGSDSGRWIIIEPAKECVDILRQLSNVEVIEAAAGEVPAMMKLYSNAEASGWASLHQRSDTLAQGVKFTARDVPVVTLDSVIETLGLERIDFLKMDLEGHELFALKGAIVALNARKVRALSFEFGAANVNSRTYFRDFWNLLTSLGFGLWRICPGGSITKIKEYYEDLEFYRGATNYVAILGSV